MRRLAVLMALSASCACLGAGENLLVNPGFEGTLGADDFGWHVRRGGAADVAEVAVDPAVSHEAAPGVRIRHRLPVYSAITQIFETRPRTIYAAQMWVRAEDVISTGRGVRLFVGDERGRTVTADRIRDYEADGSWRQLTCIFNSGERPAMCLVPMVHNACGTVWFADPSVREVTPDEAAALTGRKHGWAWVQPHPGGGMAYFGRDAVHVCRDFPTPIWLSRRLAFADPEAAGLRMVLNLPQGIEVAGGYPGWQIESREQDGRNHVTLTGATDEYCPLYLTTKWRPGREGEARLWLEWDQGWQQPPFTFTVRCIAVPEGARPRRLIAGLSGPPLGELYPGDFVSTARRLGFNTVNMWSSAAWRDEPDPDFVAQVSAYTDAGLWVSDNYSPMHYGWYRDELAATEDAQACNIEGVRNPTIPCPSYRGELCERMGTHISNMARSGISWAHLDEEIWNGHGICFCERCLARWEQYRAERHPGLPGASPLEFEADPASHPALHEAWTGFKCHMVTEMFAGWRQMLIERAAETGARSSPEPWLDAWLAVSPHLADRYYFLHDPADLVQGLDHQVPMIYDTADVVRRELAGLVVAAGREHLLAGLTAGEPSNGRQVLPPEETRASALEAVFAPTMGYVLWTWHRSDLATLVALAGVHDIMARAEDVLLDGERSDRLEVVRGDALVTAYELDDRLIAFVRDYDEPGEVTLRLVGTAVWVVRDMDSGARVERLTAGRREFTLDLADGNSRVIECAPH